MRWKALARPPLQVWWSFDCITTYIILEMSVMTMEKNGKVETPNDGSQPLPQWGQQHAHQWHALETKEVLGHLRVHGNGLTTEEAKQRLDHFGPNQLEEAPRPTFLQMLWEQLNNFVVILLIIASVISALLGDYVEAGAIMAIVVLNAVLGIVQERRAEELAPQKLAGARWCGVPRYQNPSPAEPF
jgi:Ca2+-transporting ATPase